MAKDRSILICWIAAWLLLAGPLVLRLWVLISTPISGLRDIVEFIFDDGYYYLRIAANVADSGRSTFDGLTATNGYQPLWLLTLSGLAKLVGTDARTFFLAACSLIYAIACATPLLAIAWWRAPGRQLALCTAAALAIVIIQQPVVFLQGLEPILFAPLGMLLVMKIERAEVTAKMLLWLSGALAVAFLVRLDSIALYVAMIFCLPLFEVLAGTISPQNVPRRMVEVAARLSIFVIPTLLAYLAVNQWLFGSPIPVSGLAKQIGGARFSNWGGIEIFFRSRNSFAVLIAILVVLEWLTRRQAPRPGPMFYRSIAILLVTLSMQILYYAAFSSWYVWPWYTYLVAVLMALLIARIIYLSSLLFVHRAERIAASAALLLVGVWAANHSLAFVLDSVPPKVLAEYTSRKPATADSATNAQVLSFNQISLDMLAEFFKPGQHTMIAMGDRAGGLAYWGRRNLSVIQTEGLTFDVKYLAARAANTGEQYLESFPIDYLLVDRQVIATLADADGHTQYVVPEPIQGRINNAPVPTFCFPPEAIRYRKSYLSVYGVNVRIAFAFSGREPCRQQSITLMRSIENGIGLRQYSLPGEYNSAEGGILDRRSEDRDRHYSGSASNR
jgi:hypothetical protein